MLRRLFFPLLLGLGGCAILLALGTWQLQRLAWKQDLLSRIEAEIHAPPAPLPGEGAAARFQPVEVSGILTGDHIRVLVSRKQIGPGYRIVAPLETGGRRILVDLGFLPEGQALPPIAGPVTVRGNMDLPAEVDGYTPAPDLGRNLWFARDVPAMAAGLGTEVTFVAASRDVVPGIEAMPLTSATIPNDHLQYAITWFLLATVWAGMTGLLIWRIARAKS